MRLAASPRVPEHLIKQSPPRTDSGIQEEKSHQEGCREEKSRGTIVLWSSFHEAKAASWDELGSWKASNEEKENQILIEETLTANMARFVFCGDENNDVMARFLLRALSELIFPFSQLFQLHAT